MSDTGFNSWKEDLSIDDVNKKYYQNVLCIVLSILGHDENGDAEVITNESLFRLNNHPEVSESGIKAWLIKTAGRLAISSLRHKKARPVTSLDAILDDIDAKGGYLEKYFIQPRPDDAEVAERELEEEMERRRLDFELKRKALSLCLIGEFHEWEQAIFNMYNRDGQSYKVIGEILNMKPDMVTKQNYRINAKIQRHLQEYQKRAASA